MSLYYFLGRGGGQRGGQTFIGGGGVVCIRGRHHNEGCTIKSPMGVQCGGGHGVNGGPWPLQAPHSYATVFAPSSSTVLMPMEYGVLTGNGFDVCIF